MTKQRAAILEVIRSEKRHFTVEEIFELVKKKLPTISKATVYNNLHALEEEEMIRRIAGEGKSARYDSSYVQHGHLFCKDCGRIYDFSIPEFEKTLFKCTEANIESYELKLIGVCNKCRAAANKI